MKKSTYLSLLIALVVAMFTSCGEDRTHEYYEKTEENQWIYSKMKEVYLWRDQIKEPSRTTFFSNTTKFFNSLIYSGDKVSYFTDTIITINKEDFANAENIAFFKGCVSAKGKINLCFIA